MTKFHAQMQESICAVRRMKPIVEEVLLRASSAQAAAFQATADSHEGQRRHDKLSMAAFCKRLVCSQKDWTEDQHKAVEDRLLAFIALHKQ